LCCGSGDGERIEGYNSPLFELGIVKTVSKNPYNFDKKITKGNEP
tara:strand:+ start:631 stop:765 length:135 start_codon:yes stop_codon:yes gene_type:complete